MLPEGLVYCLGVTLKILSDSHGLPLNCFRARPPKFPRTSVMKTYQFRPTDACNMCGAGVEHHRTMGRRLDRSQGWRPRSRVGAATTVVRCRRCGLVFANPMPIPVELAQHYAVDPLEYFGANYVNAPLGAFQSQIDIFRAICGEGEGVTALDIGSGTGHTMATLREAGFSVRGLEPSPVFRNHAIETFDFSPDQIVEASVEDADFAPGSFDFVTFGAVLEHLPDPAAAIESAVRWLRPGGVIHAEIPSVKWLIGRLLNFYFGVTATGLVTNLSPMHAPYHLYEFSVEAFSRHGSRAGYEVERSYGYVCDPFVGGIAGSILKRVMRWTGTGMQLVVWLRAPNVGGSALS